MSKETFIYWFKVVMALLVAFAFMMLGIWFGEHVVGKFNKNLGWGIGYLLAMNFVSVLLILYKLNIRGSEWDDKPDFGWKAMFRIIILWNTIVIVCIIFEIVWNRLD
jgi:hypothetical protein